MKLLQLVKKNINLLCSLRGYEVLPICPPPTGEVVSLAFALFRLRFPSKVFLQIGASDGHFNDPVVDQVKLCSNPSILVEPVPANFAALQSTYANSQHVRLVQAALSSNEGKQSLYVVKRAGRWAASPHASQLGSFNRNHLIKHGVLDREIEEIAVPCLSFVNLLTHCEIQNIGFMLSDTEGYDAEVVRLALEAGLLPEFICFEHIHIRDVWSQTCDRLSQKGYRFVYDKQNCLAFLDKVFQ